MNRVHVIPESVLLEMLRRCEAGENADLVYAELYVNAERRTIPPDNQA